jgi:predicted aspartyl protease
MGRVAVEVELANNEDLVLVHLGMLPVEKVRRVRLPGFIDTGATRLMLPASAVAQLGLTPSDKTTVRYADGRTLERDVVYNVWLTLQGRGGIFTAVVEPHHTDALIGAIVLEDLDLLVDCKKNSIYPRDPNTIISEAE